MTNTSSANDSTGSLRERVESAFNRGEVVDLSSSQIAHNDASQSRNWGPDRTIEADWLVPILLRARNSDPTHAEKLILRGARVSGSLDLGCGHIQPFLFQECGFDDAPNLADSYASFAGFVGCWIPGINASRMKCTGPIWLTDSTVSGELNLDDCDVQDVDAARLRVVETNGRHAHLNLTGAKIGHDLNVNSGLIDGSLGLVGAAIEGKVDLGGIEIRLPNRVAIRAQQSSIRGSLLAPKSKISGAVVLEGAIIGGAVVFDESKIACSRLDALSLDHAQVNLGFLARDMELEGRLSLHHARIACQVGLVRSKISNPHGGAIRADHLEVNGSLLISDGAEIDGSIDLHAAKIECMLGLRRTTLKNSGEEPYVLDCNQASIRGGIVAPEVDVNGSVSLRGATVSGDISINGGSFRASHDRFAINFDGAEVSGELKGNHDVSLIGGLSARHALFHQLVDLSESRIERRSGRSFRATTASFHSGVALDRATVSGTIDLAGSEIGGDLRCVDAKLGGTPPESSSRGVSVDPEYGGSWRGTSLRMTDSSVSGDVNLRGAEILQTVDLAQANVEQTVDFHGAVSLADQGPAISADEIKAGAIRLTFRAQPLGASFFRFATIGRLTDDHQSWPSSADVEIVGMSYGVLDSELDCKSRLTWLSRASSRFAPQPYEQLASSYERDGQPSAARRVRHEALRRYHHSGSFPMRLWGKIQDVTIGFGYRPFLALTWALVAWFLGGLYFHLFTGSCTSPALEDSLCPIGQGGPHWSPFLYSLDLIMPFVSLGQERAWDPTGTARIVALALIVSGWLLLTVVVTAIARTLKRS